MQVNHLIAALVFSAVLGLPTAAMANIRVQTNRVNVSISDSGNIRVDTPGSTSRSGRYSRRPAYYRTSGRNCRSYQSYRTSRQGNTVYSSSSTSTTVC
ncbi:hypothetical protein GS597_16900 [Synechococcales cyanobacterium C]|uniref:Uncharacterized protein n=1 Tax=Petrachloros mirabilis ULC683 TaxID=2781853 RepID=A0A8K2A9F9_9CYAN|nr:hypothetical protein [Petrachloros mirabilis]NCJ08155.1 hypothetical protein [Petrachloros mirabilis ULC683]